MGCVLHGASHKSPVVFTDAISLCVSATTAAILTTIWVLGDTTVSITQHPPSRPKPKVWVQHCLGKAADGTTDFGWAEIRGDHLTDARDGPLTCQIPDLLRVVQSLSASSTVNFGDVFTPAQIALAMWGKDCIQVKLGSRSLFVDNGLSDVRSFSRFQDETLQITVQGFDFGDPSSHSINAKM